MAGPTVIVDLDKIEHNARAVTGLCGDHGISVTAVTKVTCGMPQVARALLRGGAAGIGESRLENVHRLRANGIVADMMLLRIPPLSGAEEIVRSVDVSLNSELSVIRALSEAAYAQGITHRIIMMIDLGDLREGFWPDDVPAAAREIVELPNVRLAGVGTNLTCYGGVVPTRENMQQLVDWAHRIEDLTGVGMEIISGGNSSSLPLLASGKMPEAINHLRIGESILLGRETIDRSPWPGTVQDAFRIEAEIIELKEKPSVPIGQTGQDAFGHRPSFEDRGERLRAILNIGREDVDVDGLTPVDEGRTILGASSDHLLVDVGSPAEPGGGANTDRAPGDSGAGDSGPGDNDAAEEMPKLGGSLEFVPNYSALLAAMTSSYVSKRSEGGERPAGGPWVLRFFGTPLSEDRSSAFIRTLENIGFRIEMHPGAKAAGEHLAPISGGGVSGAVSVGAVSGGSGQGSLRSAIASCFEIGEFPLLSGRHSLTAQGFSGFADGAGEAGLIWISPYASIRDTYSGSDVLGRLLRRSLENGEGVVHAGGGKEAAGLRRPEETFVAPGADNLILVGLREVDREEADIIHRLGIRVFTMEDIDRTGIQGVMRKALQHAVIGTRGLYVHFDERLSDNGQEGLTTRETHMMMEIIARTGFMRVLDVSGIHLGSRRRRKLQKFVSSALGKRILG